MVGGEKFLSNDSYPNPRYFGLTKPDANSPIIANLTSLEVFARSLDSTSPQSIKATKATTLTIAAKEITFKTKLKFKKRSNNPRANARTESAAIPLKSKFRFRKITTTSSAVNDNERLIKKNEINIRLIASPTPWRHNPWKLSKAPTIWITVTICATHIDTNSNFAEPFLCFSKT